MQLQIECNGFTGEYQICWICSSPFETQEARVIACSDQGRSYGEICPHCLEMGFDWLSDRFEELIIPKRPLVSVKSKVDLMVGV